MSDLILEVKDLYVNFYTYAGVVKAIDGVSFSVKKGEIFGLVGETGCGKTVTSRAIARLIESPGKIEKGEILYYRNGKPIDLLKLSEKELREIRGKEIAYIFQDPGTALDPLYTSGYQIAETMIYHKTANKTEAWKRAVEILREVLVPEPETNVKSYPHELSGGMKQRVMIGVSVSNRPKLLIADEPTTAVDVTVQAEIIDLLKGLQKKYNTAVILITHNMGLIAEMADRVAVMYAGNIVEIADVYTIFESPEHPYTKGLLKAVPNPMKRIETLYQIRGMVPNLIFPPPGCRFHPRCDYAMDICKKEKPKLIEIEKDHYVACWLHQKEGEK
ncbi:MAG: ABC transporter ATP-binding protein [Candidatus Njordarchaeia archaeon]